MSVSFTTRDEARRDKARKREMGALLKPELRIAQYRESGITSGCVLVLEVEQDFPEM